MVSAKKRKLDLELYLAFGHENAEEVQRLIALGADADAVSKDTGWSTPLWMTVNSAGQEISKKFQVLGVGLNEILPNMPIRNHAAERSHCRRVIQMLIEAKADVNKLSNGSTPLRIAVHWNDLEIVKLLLANGANANSESFTVLSKLAKKVGRKILLGYWNTILHEAVENNSLPIVEVLMAAGADVMRVDHQGKTPLDIARKKRFEPIVEVLEKVRPK